MKTKSMEDKVMVELKNLVDDRTLPLEEKTTLVLHRIQDALTKASVGPEQDLVSLKRRLMDASILDFCLAAMRLDRIAFAAEGSECIAMETWRTAVQLAQLLSSCCVGAEPDTDRQAFYGLLLPSVMEGLLSLASRLMGQVAERAECLSLYRTVMDSVGWLLGAYSCLTPQVLSSLSYERMQVCDDVIISLVCVSLWSKICTTDRDFLSGLSDDIVLLLINDAVGQLAVSSDDAVGGACIGLLVLIANQLERPRHALLRTFTGLDRLLSQDWRRRGFNKEIDQLIAILHSDWPTAEHTHTQACERARAACVIQAAWRGHVTRNRIKNLPRAVGILQRKYREKVRQRKLLEQTSFLEEELKYQVYIRRQRARRSFHQKQRQLLHLLPAELVQRYQHQLEGSAAVAIQRWWRVHRERRSFQTLCHARTQHRAACTLQRVVLSFLKKRRGLQASLTGSKLIGPMGLTDRRRAKLYQEVECHVRHNPSCVGSQQACEQLFLETQTLLLQHHTQSGQHTHALLAHINTQLDLLEDAPSLCVATGTDVEVFHSRSGPVVAWAQRSHDALLQASGQPWWKKLDNHDDITSSPCPSSPEELNVGFDFDWKLDGPLEIL